MKITYKDSCHDIGSTGCRKQVPFSFSASKAKPNPIMISASSMPFIKVDVSDSQIYAYKPSVPYCNDIHLPYYANAKTLSCSTVASNKYIVSPIKLTQFRIFERTYRFSEPRVFDVHLDPESSYWVINDNELNIHVFGCDKPHLEAALHEELDYLMVNYSSHPENDLNEKTISRIRRLKSILERVS